MSKVRTLSKPAMLRLSAKNSAGLFCCRASAFFPIQRSHQGQCVPLHSTHRSCLSARLLLPDCTQGLSALLRLGLLVLLLVLLEQGARVQTLCPQPACKVAESQVSQFRITLHNLEDLGVLHKDPQCT